MALLYLRQLSEHKLSLIEGAVRATAHFLERAQHPLTHRWGEASEDNNNESFQRL